MAIDKLTALEKGNVANSDGSDIASSVNALIDKVELGLVEADITDLDKYTQAEADALLDAKSDNNHDHNGEYATASQGALADSALQSTTGVVSVEKVSSLPGSPVAGTLYIVVGD